MASEIVCMSLGTVPPGEQRSRFLAVGLADQTVRIISLDPSVSIESCRVIIVIYLSSFFPGYPATSEHASFACSSREPLHS